MVLPSLLCTDPPTGVALLSLPGTGRVVGVAVRSGTQAQPLISAALTALRSYRDLDE
jgi:hypothetical protein